MFGWIFGKREQPVRISVPPPKALAVVTPQASFELGCPACLVTATPEMKHILVQGLPGPTFLFDDELRLQRQLRHYEMQAVAISADGTLIAFRSSSALHIITRDGTVVYKKSSQPDAGASITPECLFSDDGRFFWSVEHLADYRTQLEVRDTSTWDVVATCFIDTPEKGIPAFLDWHPNRSTVSIWAPAGQDGQWVFWAVLEDGHLTVSRAVAVVNTTWPAFHASGKEFVVVKDLYTVARFSFPECALLGELEWDESLDDGLGDFCCYIADTKVAVSSTNGRLFVVDLTDMSFAGEISVAGHPPRACHELYPMLKENAELIGDLQFFQRLGRDGIVSVHSLLPQKKDGVENGKDVVVLWDSDGLADQVG
ncbi:MAG: hypothetical protein K8T91_14090 [Planctomycetes bacterium]|nr:hypothetical protein [Planctomycetota bacterium]